MTARSAALRQWRASINVSELFSPRLVMVGAAGATCMVCGIECGAQTEAYTFYSGFCHTGCLDRGDYSPKGGA